MGLGRRITGLSLILLMLTCELQTAILALASANSQAGTHEVAGGTGEIEFLRRQLENGVPPDGPLLERGYVVPSGMNLSLADEIWLKIAPLISLGYDEREMVKAVDGLRLPKRIGADGVSVLLDYANLRVTRSLENGEVSVEIPVLCNSSLSSVHYEVKGVKKRVKLYNVTSLKYYNVSVRAPDLYEVNYSKEEGVFSEAILDLNGDIKNNVIDVYFPNLEKPVFSEICFNLPFYGVSLSLRVIERKVYDIGSGGKSVDCYWIHFNATLRASRDVFRVMFRIRHGGGWVNKPWLILRKGEYSSDHWVKWTPSHKLIVDFFIEGFGNMFILNFETTETRKDFLSRILSEDELKVLLDQPPFLKLNLSKAPKVWDIRLAGEKVTNETVWVTGQEYERLMKLGWREEKSFFIDSGEAKWEYAITNRTLDQCKSIRFFYNPLKVNRGELVHGLTLRNYANVNVSYTLRLRTTTSLFFFFSKVEEGNGGITLNKASIASVLLVQQQPAAGDAVLELVKDGRIVAAVKVSLALKSTMYWKGFWDGLATKLPGIIVTAGVMVAMGFLIPHAYIRPAYYLLLGLGVLSNLAEVALDIAEANKAREEMLTLAEAFENRSREFLANGEAEHAAECVSFATMLRREVNDTMNNLMLNVLSDLAIGVSLDEIRIALGLKEPLARDELERQYKIGYARGRVTGAAISCVLYITLFIMVNRIKAEGTGQRLTAGQVLRMIARGIYNWVTPSVWDAFVLMQEKIEGFASNVVGLLLANKYSRRFGDAIGSLLNGVKGELPRVGDTLDASSRISRDILESVPSRESSSKILDAVGAIFEHYSPEEMKEKGGTVTRSIVSMWIKDGDEAINNLNSWLSENTKDVNKVKVLDGILLKIGGEAAKGVGLRIGAIVDTYLIIENKYRGKIGEVFLDKVLRNPEELEEVFNALSSLNHFRPGLISTSINKNGVINLKDGISKGIYIARLRLEGGKEIEFAFSVEEESAWLNVPNKYLEGADSIVGEGIADLEIYEYKFETLFPNEFSAGGKRITLDYVNRKISIDGKEVKYEIKKMWCTDGKVRARMEIKAKNIDGKNLEIVLYEDHVLKIWSSSSETGYPVTDMKLDDDGVIRITYIREANPSIGEYSIKLGPLQLHGGQLAVELNEEIKGQTQLTLKERLFRKLGYDAYQELVSRMREGVDAEDRLVIIAEYDNGVKYCGNKRLAVHVPTDAKILKLIHIISLEESSKMKVKMMLCKIIENPEGNKWQIGVVGEIVLRKKYGDTILAKFAETCGIPQDSIRLEPSGEESGKSGFPDLYVITNREIIIKGKTIPKDTKIGIVEAASTMLIDNVDQFRDQMKKAIIDLKDHIGREQNAYAGIAISFAYDPACLLLDSIYPELVDSYKNPLIVIFRRPEIMEKNVNELVSMAMGG